MNNTELEKLVHYQDIDLMMREAEEVEKTLGFQIEGCEKLQAAKEEQARHISPRYLNTYKRLRTRYKRPIVPVKDDTCLGCFAKLPTAFMGMGKTDQKLMTCEHCGRILYWMV
ncbi:hypothetical protein JW948_13120 [bacterium]|nr:hypothetical protein [bacterium]